MSFRLGKKSLRELIGVHPELAFAVTEAIKVTRQDFTVFDGVRTKKEQEKLVARGVSKTNNSYHLYGLAVDLVAWVEGKPSWDPKYYKEIGIAMKKVIKKHNLDIDWGYEIWGWDMPHFQLSKINNTDARKRYDVRKYL